MIQGSKTYSHLETVLTRYLKVITALLTEEDSAVNLLSVVNDFWMNSSQHRSYVMSKLMTYRIVKNIDIADWVFSDAALINCHRFHSWEVLKEASGKILAKTADLRELYKESKAANDSKLENRKASLEEAEHDSQQFSLHVMTKFMNRISSNPPKDCAITNTAFEDTLCRRLKAFCRLFGYV